MPTTAATLSSNPDLDLATRHRYGDPQAFEEVHERFAQMVFNLAYRMSGTIEVAEDLAQETFIRIYRHLGRFNGRSTLKTWVYRVTVNHCRSKLGRRRYPSQPLAEENAGEGVKLVDEGRSPEDLTVARDTGRQVSRALLEVGVVFREAVILRDLEGLSYDEIAEVLGVRIGTVRSRIARGRERLRIVLEKDS